MSDPWGGVGGWNDPRYTWTPDPNIDPYNWGPNNPAPAGVGTRPTLPQPAAAPAQPMGTLAAPAPLPTATPLDRDQQDAFDRLRDTFHRYGLDDPAMLDWAKDQIIHGTSEASITLDLYDPKSVPGKLVDRKFPELRMRREKGFAPLSIAEAVSYRDNAVQMFRAAGLPPSFYDQPDDLGRLVGGDVSLSELKSRVDEASVAAQQAPAETRQQLNSLYGIAAGGLVAYYLDPDKALPLLQKQFAAASLSGSAVQSGYGGLDRTQAERLAALGLGADQAQTGFGKLVQSRELFGALPGEAGIGAVSRDEQLAAAFGGDAAAQERLQRTAAARRAVFGEGGSFAAGQKGIAGLGSAAT
jgi:hypothetical protein